MESIKQILIRRDGLNAAEADQVIDEALNELDDCDMNIKDVEDILKYHFSLEPDYLFQLLDLWEARNAKK